MKHVCIESNIDKLNLINIIIHHIKRWSCDFYFNPKHESYSLLCYNSKQYDFSTENPVLGVTSFRGPLART